MDRDEYLSGSMLCLKEKAMERLQFILMKNSGSISHLLKTGEEKKLKRKEEKTTKIVLPSEHFIALMLMEPDVS